MAKKTKSKASSNTAYDATTAAPAAADNDDLLNDLLAQIDEKNAAQQQEAAIIVQEVQLNDKAEELERDPSAKKDSRSRFEARKLRRAAEQVANYPTQDEASAAQIERETREEERAIRHICDDLGVMMHEVNPDGHCMYTAIADQLRLLGILKQPSANYAVMRAAAADYIAMHPDDFLPFLPSVEGEDGVGANSAGMMGPREFQRYCANVRNSSTWGGQPELRALSRAFNIPIHVIQGTTPPIVVQNPNGDPETPYDEKRVVRISYHRRMYGLGEHYNSLRPKTLVHQLKEIVS